MLYIVSTTHAHYILRSGLDNIVITKFKDLREARQYVRDLQRMERIIEKRKEA